MRGAPAAQGREGRLKLMLGAGADANHEPRTFTFPIGAAHLAVIERDLPRHLLLWSAVLPLCEAAGTGGALDEVAAVALLDPILLAPPTEVDALFRRVRWDAGRLVAHGADTRLLREGRVHAALRGATETPNHRRAQEYRAGRRRAERGVVLGPLDTALLTYTGRYAHGATVPRRLPDAVAPALLPEVLAVVAIAERACADLRIGLDPRRGRRATDKRAWERMQATAETALRRAHPVLADDAVRTVAVLLCSEAAHRARNAPREDEGETGPDGKAALTFTDDKGRELKWRRGGPRTATAAFWDFVADHAAGDNEVFTIEDEERGEGVQVHFYADSLARITTVGEGRAGAEPRYRVEYCLADGIEGYRLLVAAFTRGGCAALDGHGPWLPDVTALERARRTAR
ncbi:DUF6357 family protein [Streptomyces sp. NPDC097619]|uniref:DUF6357 family protein n=1 Tax=Streptomyces sp. NPDC097619 TaxID=3157228 RepID=UPI003317D3E2